MQAPSLLVAAGALILLALGGLHLRHTFVGTALHPRDRNIVEAMKSTSPRITAKTTMWRGWIGFNASHSLGAIVFGLVYGYLSLAAPALLFSSFFLLTVGMITLIGYVVICRRYFFSIPMRGTALAAVLYAVGVVTSWS